ncbi:MAG: hypothetical protein ACLQOO_21860 [Terriglobia bacterium]
MGRKKLVDTLAAGKQAGPQPIERRRERLEASLRCEPVVLESSQGLIKCGPLASGSRGLVGESGGDRKGKGRDAR